MPTADPEIAAEYTQALANYEASRPRSLQVALGPSELGGCREFIRNRIVGTPGEPGTQWPAAAATGTLLGKYIEDVASEAFGTATEAKVTTALPNGLIVAGHADIVDVEKNRVLDVKSKDGLDSIREEGPSLENVIQISTYVLGLVQAGILEEGATASLLYVDRSGREQKLEAITLSWEEINGYINVLIERLDSVVHAQEQIDIGELESAHHLRDKPPSFCFSEKVECPFRNACWSGSDFAPTGENIVEDPDMIEIVEKYARARTRANSAKEEQTTLRTEIKALGLDGKRVGDYSVTLKPTSYGGEALYVTKVGKAKK